MKDTGLEKKARMWKGETVLRAALLSTLLLAQAPTSRPGDIDRREDAYRQNNIGVARLEQYDYAGAVAAFERALELRPDLTAARVNLAIALLYEGQLEAAAKEVRMALTQLPASPQPHFVLGLIARAANRSDEAAAAFQQVIDRDGSDVGSRVQLGQVRLAERRFVDAVQLFEAAQRLEPFNATAAYGLAVALTRGGDRERGEHAMAAFQRLRDNPAAVTYSSTYLEQGRYGEALASTGLEPELIDKTVPRVAFVDATASAVAAQPPAVHDVSLADVDGDGDFDLWIAARDGVHLLRNTGGRFAVPSRVAPGAARSALAGDYDNDGVKDLLVLTDQGVALYRQEPDGTFRDVSGDALPAGTSPARTAAFLDADHDGDLDVMAGGRLLRNNGNTRFQDVTADAQLRSTGSAVAIVPLDVDNRRDVDLLVVTDGASPALFSNQRDGTFREVAKETGLPQGGPFTVAAAADINKDTLPDFFFGRAGAPGVFALSRPGGKFTVSDAPAASSGASAAQLVDYDNDGLPDLFALTTAGPRLWRSIGGQWIDVTSRTLPSALVTAADPATTLAIADVDADGDEDAVVRLVSGTVRVWRNDGGNRHPSVRVHLTARVSNRDALGAKVELRAGSLRHKIETMATTPAAAPADVLFGLGTRTRADVVRVLWPAGILQAEADVPAAVASITELDRKPSSCPFLYTWNGTRFEFLTDFLGGGELGYWVAPGVRSVPDPDEYVRIPAERLRERDGRYELRITNELEEALFLDRVQLLAVGHPDDVEVHPNEGLRSPEERSPFVLYSVRGPRPPLSVTDEHGHDVRDRIATRDWRSVDDFQRSPIQGYADEHALTIDTGASASDGRVLLLLTGWTDYAFSSDNVAAQQAGLRFRPPALEVKDSAGQWRTVMPEVGVPVGRPQTVVIDLTPHTRLGSREFRVTTTLRVYWDQILVDRSTEAATTVTRLDADAAELRVRGFSAAIDRGRDRPPSYDYNRVSATMLWKLLPGRYTRYGDVNVLLAATDDRFVVAAPGDEIVVSFDAAAAPPLPRGWTRTFLLHADGFSKEMNLHSASPDDLAPLPFHNMTSYPYAPPERYPATLEHQRYRDEYNTRVIGRRLPPLENPR
ncbi:MAG: FG-GAP-like repeat-containing protein [Vicinamibacterales bacterium]